MPGLTILVAPPMTPPSSTRHRQFCGSRIRYPVPRPIHGTRRPIRRRGPRGQTPQPPRRIFARAGGGGRAPPGAPEGEDSRGDHHQYDRAPQLRDQGPVRACCSPPWIIPCAASRSAPPPHTPLTRTSFRRGHGGTRSGDVQTAC